ncbi:hypothetical protein PMAYCL1PPCAC_06607, partial [Pristionchus mayeri]
LCSLSGNIFSCYRAMNDSQMDAEDVLSIMQCVISDYLTPSAFADDHKLLIRTRSAFKQAIREEKKIRSSSEQEKLALEAEISHSKAKISEMKADCEWLKAELSSIEGENAKLEKEATGRKVYLQELKTELVARKIEQFKILKLNAERNLNIAINESQRLERKIEARRVGAFAFNDTQRLIFDNGNLRIQGVVSH